MKKYGIEKFSVETIEECGVDNASERERYWIEFYGSYKNGYNATRGGDGRNYIDYNVVVSTYLRIKTEKETASFLSIDVGTVRKALAANGMRPLSSQDWSKSNFGHVIDRFSLSGEYIDTFASAHDAAKCVLPNVAYSHLHGPSGHIAEVCKGTRNSAYGFLWRYGTLSSERQTSINATH